MADYISRDISPTPAGGNSDRPDDKAAAVRRALPDKPQIKSDHTETPAGDTDSVEPVLASQRFVEKANQLTKQKERMINHLFQPSHLKLLAGITGAGVLIVAITVIIRNFSEINEKIREYRSLINLTTGTPLHPRSSDSGAPEQSHPVFREKSQPEGRTASNRKVSGRTSTTDLTGNSMVSRRKKVMSPASEPSGFSRDKPVSRPYPGSQESPSLPATRQNSAEDPLIAHFNDEQDDYGDNITQFYEPVNAGKNIGRGSSRASSRRSYRYSQSEAPEQSPVRQNRTRMIAGMVHSFGGTFINLIEHNGDYYKMKLSLPNSKVEPFKNALAKKTIIASFSVSTISSMHQTSTLILEIHSR